MNTEFEKKIVQKLDEISKGVRGLDELNRNIEKLIKILVENEGRK